MARSRMVQFIKPHFCLFALALTINPARGDDVMPSVQPTFSEESASRLVRETIRPDEIRSNGGSSYTARLRLNREGDKNSSGSGCTLFEDGKPLPHPQARHNAIRDQGQGRYSHWTSSQLYFSASDSSDPRTNGRTYELVSNESFVRRTAQAVIVDDHVTLAIQAPKDQKIRPVRLSLKNCDEQRTIIPHMKHWDDPDLTSVASIVTSITNQQMTDEQRAIALWQFLVDWRYHDYPAEERGEIHDPVKLINVYGYGFCDDSAAALCVLAEQAGMKTRSYGLSGHVVAEVSYDGAWHMFDPDHQVFYRTQHGHVASVEELELHPELITREATDPLGVPSQRMAEVYTTQDDNRSYQAHVSESLDLRPILGPGDQVVFDFLKRQRVHRRAHLDKPIPRSFGNGTLTQTRSLGRHQQPGGESLLHIQWPYVILGGTLDCPIPGAEQPLAISVSADGVRFEPLEVETHAKSKSASIDAWIDAQASAVYQYWLKVETAEAFDPSHPNDEIRVHTDFQFAPRAQPQVKPGTNEFDVRVDGEGELPLRTWAGLRVELTWDELSDE